MAGYLGGRWEYGLMRLTDIFLAIPPSSSPFSILGVMKPTLLNGMIAVTAMWWPWYNRLVYNITRGEKAEGYVLAAEVTGASRAHIMFREILPTASRHRDQMTLDAGFVILIASSLSFLGLGVQAPTPDLGSMVAEGAKYLPTNGGSPSSPASPSCRGLWLQPNRRRVARYPRGRPMTPLLDIRDLRLSFKLWSGRSRCCTASRSPSRAANVSRLSGESGSGKSVTARLVLGLIQDMQGARVSAA